MRHLTSILQNWMLACFGPIHTQAQTRSNGTTCYYEWEGTSDIKGMASKFACPRPVWNGPSLTKMEDTANNKPSRLLLNIQARNAKIETLYCGQCSGFECCCSEPRSIGGWFIFSVENDESSLRHVVALIFSKGQTAWWSVMWSVWTESKSPARRGGFWYRYAYSNAEVSLEGEKWVAACLLLRASWDGSIRNLHWSPIPLAIDVKPNWPALWKTKLFQRILAHLEMQSRTLSFYVLWQKMMQPTCTVGAGKKKQRIPWEWNVQLWFLFLSSISKHKQSSW